MFQMNQQILTRLTLTQKILTGMFSSHREEVTKAVQTTVLTAAIRNRRTRAKTQVKTRTTPAQTKQRKHLMMSQMMTVACQG